MLVLLGPPFAATESDYAALAAITGLLAYDLRTRLNAAGWGIVRVLADPQEAEKLADELRAAGYAPVLVSMDVAHDAQRPIVSLKSLELGSETLVLHLSERTMEIAYPALLTIVRGDVEGAPARTSGVVSSSAAFRAMAPSADVFREPSSGRGADSYAVADLHFATVLWAARISVRSFDFSSLSDRTGLPVQDLDRLVDQLAARAQIRVDRAQRTSSLASFAARPAPMRAFSATPGGSVPPPGQRAGDERFDAYSRLVADAERQLRGID